MISKSYKLIIIPRFDFALQLRVCQFSRLYQIRATTVTARSLMLAFGSIIASMMFL